MASSEIKTLTVGGNSYALNDTAARAALAAKQDTLTAGNNITIADNVISATDTTYSEATASEAGLMSASDKTKLNSVDTNANYYVHPTASGYKHIPAGGSSGQILAWSAAGTAKWAAPSGASYSLPAATASTLGGIKVGSGLSVTSDGTLSATGGSSGGVTRDEAVAFSYLTATASNNASTSITFEDGRGYAVLTVNSGTASFYLQITAKVNTDHYILINNGKNSSDATVILYAPVISGATATTVLVPADGITVPAGQHMEISVAAVNGDTAIITASAALKTN